MTFEWNVIDKIIKHPVVSGLIVIVISSLCVWLKRSVFAKTDSVLLKRRKFPCRPAHVKKYKEDDFSDIHWRWRYDECDAPETLTPFCQKCDTELTKKTTHDITGYTEIDDYLCCGNCDFQRKGPAGSNDALCDNVTKQIERKIRNGDWKKVKRQTGRNP